MNNEQQAVSLQEKLEFYFVGLVFTLLGLSVQTLSRDRTDPWHYFDVLGCFLLFVSGLSGLTRLESLFRHFKFHARRDHLSDARSVLRKRLDREEKLRILGGGSDTTEITGLASLTDEQIADAEQWITKNEKTHALSYYSTKWTFVGGLIALFVSRAFPTIWK